MIENRFSALFITLALLLLGACKSTKSTSSSPAVFTPAGTWTYEVLDTPDGDVSGEMILEASDSGYAGKIVSSEGETPLEGIVMDDKKLGCTFNARGYEAELAGAFKEDNFSGTVSIAGYEFPIVMTRKK